MSEQGWRKVLRASLRRPGRDGETFFFFAYGFDILIDAVFAPALPIVPTAVIKSEAGSAAGSYAGKAWLAEYMRA